MLNRRWGSIRTRKKRSPAAAPFVPGSPCPDNRITEPSRTPAGMVTSIDFGRPMTPAPRQVGQTLLSFEPLPRQSGQVSGQESLRSEEHTSELQSHHDLVCRLLLEKKKKKKQYIESNTLMKTQN